MKIGFDLDNTLIDFTEAINLFVKNKYNIEHKGSYSLGFVDNELPENIAKDIKDSFGKSIFLKTVKIIPDVYETLIKLQEKGHELYLITARDGSKSEIKDITLDLIYCSYFPGIKFKSIVFCKDKNKYLDKFNLDFFIDDNPDIFMSAVPYVNRVLLISNENTFKYNGELAKKLNPECVIDHISKILKMV